MVTVDKTFRKGSMAEPAKSDKKNAEKKPEKSPDKKVKLKGYGKKKLHKIKKETVKLEKAVEKSVLARDRVNKITTRLDRVRLNIEKSTVAEVSWKNSERFRNRLQVIREQLKDERDNLALIKKKIKKHKNKIKELKTRK